MATELHAQPADPNVDVRVVGDEGPTNFAVVEPSIAVGHDAVVIADFRVGAKSRYAVFNRATGVWSAAAFSVPWTSGTTTSVDLSVAYDPNTRSFVATALGSHHPTGGMTTHYILAAKLVPDPNHVNGIGEFGTFSPIDASPQGLSAFDIPWVVAGGWGQVGREYYCVYWYPELDADPNSVNADPAWPASGYKYRRSIDGGATWQGGIVRLDGLPVGGVWCAKPTVYRGRDLFIAYNHTDTEIRFLHGIDPVDPNAVRGVTFVELETECEVGPSGPLYDPPPPPVVQLNKNFAQIKMSLPGNQTPNRVPQLIADPSDAGRMYLVYHDTDTEDPNDMDLNVYFHALTGSGNQWCASERAIVGTDDLDLDDDQFMPSVAVDDHGYIHVVYYDDRRYTDQGDVNDPNNPPRFDCYYAYSIDGGLNWTEERLDGANPDDPAVNCADLPDLREYIGIDWFGDDVFTAYSGTIPYDPQNPPPTDPGVIWSSRIRW